MADLETPARLINQLGLRPLGREGGWFRETWRVPSPGHGTGSMATSILYLLAPGQHSRLHCLPGPELYFHHAGAPLAILILGEEKHAHGRRICLGPNIDSGEIPQVEVPGGAIHGSHPLGDPGWSLVSTVMVPGFKQADYQEPDNEYLVRKYPALAELIRFLK